MCMCISNHHATKIDLSLKKMSNELPQKILKKEKLRQYSNGFDSYRPL